MIPAAPDTTEDDVAPASDVDSVSETPTMDEEATAEAECPAPLDTPDTGKVTMALIPEAQDVAETQGMAEDATAPIPEPENVAETPATTDDAATPAPEVQPAARGLRAAWCVSLASSPGSQCSPATLVGYALRTARRRRAAHGLKTVQIGVRMVQCG